MNQGESWESCPEGAIERVVTAAQRRRRRLRINQLAAAATVLVLTLVVGSGSWRLWQQFQAGFLSCSETRQLLAENDLSNLPPRLQTRVSRHLDHCPHCERTHRQRSRSDTTLAPAAKHAVLMAWAGENSQRATKGRQPLVSYRLLRGNPLALVAISLPRSQVVMILLGH